jgi:shikimate kinase
MFTSYKETHEYKENVELYGWRVAKIAAEHGDYVANLYMWNGSTLTEKKAAQEARQHSLDLEELIEEGYLKISKARTVNTLLFAEALGY